VSTAESPQRATELLTALDTAAQNKKLQFTRRNFGTIRDDPDRFRQLGMWVWLPPLEFASVT
jgi:hypothetical protein